MRASSIEHYRCPLHGEPLVLAGPATGDEIREGELVCGQGHGYPVQRGVPSFLRPDALSQVEEQVKDEYDRVARDIYDRALDWQFRAFLEDEDRVRELMVDLVRLTPGMRVLEVGCGTGRDSFRLAQRLGPEGELHMQDLSPQMVYVCQERMEEYRRDLGLTCRLEYSVSNGTELPYPDDYFDAVFHFGGFNHFGDLKKGAAELTRVARRGGRVLYGDEAVAPWLKGTEFDAIVTTNNALFKADLPLTSLPECSREVSVHWVIANCFYVIAFTKGEDGPPALDLDLPHAGWRGGSLRSRYFGVMEGVTPEAKEMARQAAARAGLSVHDWLDQLVREGAAREGVQ